MTKTLIYDLPTRLFHWLFVGLFIFSFVVAKTIDDEELLFSYHMISGLVMFALILWRLLWGVIGSQHARFKSMPLRFSYLVGYFKDLTLGKKHLWTGHNPASSWAAILMLLCGLFLGVSGFFMTTGLKEEVEDFHEIASHLFLALSVLHICGLILHTLRHKDNLPLSMLTGKKRLSTQTEPSSKHIKAAWIFMIYLFIVALYLQSNFDTESKKLLLFGAELDLES